MALMHKAVWLGALAVVGCGPPGNDGTDSTEASVACPESAVQSLPDTCVCRSNDGVGIYLLCAVETSWDGAMNRCQSFGGSLLQVDDFTENDFIKEQANELDSSEFKIESYYIGANDKVDESVWVWPDGTQFYDGAVGQTVGGGVADWGAGEPDGSQSSEDCSFVDQNGQWQDTLCTSNEAEGFVCELPAAPPPTET